jgi:hypothetical protein
LPARIDLRPSLLWWDDYTALFEYSLVSHKGNPAGYVITSTHQGIPPVVEFSLEGPSLSGQLGTHWIRTLQAMEGIVPFDRLYYFGPWDFAARVSPDTTLGRYQLVSIPWGEIAEPKGPLVRDPKRFWNPSVVRSLRARYAKRTARGAQETTIVQLLRKPVRYNQSCSAYSASRTRTEKARSAPTPCSPSCISGCGPVAWAMMASAYKNGFEQAPRPNDPYRNVFTDIADWKVEWPSYIVPNPSQSKGIEDTIWTLHRVMGTSCGGNTVVGGRYGHKRILHYPVEYLRRRYGAYVGWILRGSTQFALMRQFLDTNRPLMVCGNRNWLALQRKVTASRRRRHSAQMSGTGAPGHCVVAYGYDTATQTVLICLGWGNGFYDRFIVPGGIQKGFFVYGGDQ